MKIVFFGTPQIAANSLQYLLDHGIEVVAVVTKPDKAQGRSSVLIPTPVKIVALAQNPPLPVYQPEIVSGIDFVPILESFQPDLFVVVAYGEILKQHILDIPKMVCINMHVSLLPKYRGAAPIQRCIINGEEETGVTVMHMVRKMDAGDIIAVEKMSIPPDMDFGELEAALGTLGSRLLLKTIHDFINGTASRVEQNHELATLAPKIELEDCRIDWQKSANEIHNLVRGVNPHPGAWCFIQLNDQQKRLRIISTRVIEQDSIHTPGTILSNTKSGMVVGCEKGTLLICQVQLEGKKAMNAADFFRGHAPQKLL